MTKCHRNTERQGRRNGRGPTWSLQVTLNVQNKSRSFLKNAVLRHLFHPRPLLCILFLCKCWLRAPLGHEPSSLKITGWGDLGSFPGDPLLWDGAQGWGCVRRAPGGSGAPPILRAPKNVPARWLGGSLSPWGRLPA